MAKQYPLWCRAGAIESALEVANRLCILEPSHTDADDIATLRHIGAIVELAMLATKQLAEDLCDVADKLESDEEGNQQPRDFDLFSDFFPMDDPDDEARVNADEDDDYVRFGVCPECGQSNGYLNIQKDHFGVCHKHKIIWSIGYNLFSSWMDEDEAIWKKNREILEQYEFREPVYRWRDASNPESPSQGQEGGQ